MSKKLGRLDLFKVFLRLLFLQGVLNQRGMQNIAFTSALSAVSGKLVGPKEGFLLSRHLDFFNCNPNFAPLVVGGTLKLEEEKTAGKPINDGDIEYFKRSVSSPLAAIGDMLFLGSLKPLALTFACIFAIYKSVIGLLAVFLLYNLLIVSCRLWGVYFGYSKGWELVEIFSGPGLQRVLNVIQGVGACAGGALVGIIIYRFSMGGNQVLVSAGALTILSIFLLRKDVSASWFAIFLFVVAALLSFLFG